MTKLEIDPNHYPNVLLLGNGLLKLNGRGTSWDSLISKIRTNTKDIDYKCLPYAMQPEAVCGVNVEEIQRRVSKEIEDIDQTDILLERLLALPFDAIITTNYTYEIERVLLGNKWSHYKRKQAFTALDNNPHPNHNTYICNMISTPEGRIIPVFHVHGEYERKHSMILSYYSYANNLSKLIDYNKKLGNTLEEQQKALQKHDVKCWLDYFIMGNVWSVGFGLDVSEVDIWWAIERKARENAKHGIFKCYLEGEKRDSQQSILLGAMSAQYKFVPVSSGDYSIMYEVIIEDIENDIMLS